MQNSGQIMPREYTLLSSSAEADDPVFREARVHQLLSRVTGYPAFAGYDGEWD
jgi:hypothetical protein